MAVTVSGTSITFNDATTQTTRAPIISAPAYSGYTSSFNIYNVFNGYSVARAIAALGGTDLLVAIEFSYSLASTSDGTQFATSGSARRRFRTVT
jgi:hypothetical protein